MDRKDFLKLSGLAGAAAVLPKVANAATTKLAAPPTECTLIPSETQGPFPLDLTENTFYFRQDIGEDRTGVPFKVKMRIIGADNCLPMQNVRVNIWHCDKDGLYSGYSTTNNQGQAAYTYCRGYQFTDADGQVEFNTIFPGWYSGRICHIHFQVYVSASYAAISQMTFPVDDKNTLYTANADLYTKGVDPMSLSSDNIFSDGYSQQMATLVQESDGSYSTFLEVTVAGSGVVGTSNIEKETAKQVILGQNFPNPYADQTVIPVTLMQSSEVTLDIWDLNGRKVATLLRQTLAAGEHNIPFKPADYDLPIGNYAYQIEVKNTSGLFRTCKLMTSAS